MVHNDYAARSGEEASVEGIATLLQANGHQVSWFRKSSAHIAESLAGSVSAFVSGIYCRSARAEILGLLKEETIDVAQIQNLYPLISTSVLKPLRDAGVPVVMRCPNYRLFCPAGTFFSKGEICERCAGGNLLWSLLRNCAGSAMRSLGYCARSAWAQWTNELRQGIDVYLATSQFQRQKMVDYGIDPAKVFVVGNSWAYREHPAKGLGSSVGFVGRVTLEKGFVDYMEAARRMQDHIFRVAGEVNIASTFSAELPGNVEMRGFLHGEELDEFWRSLQCLVFPSRVLDTWPNTLLEAMSRGVPVVAPRLGAIPEIVEDGVTGLLYQAGDVGDLVVKLRQILDAPGHAVAMGRKGRERARRLCDPHEVWSQFHRAYEHARGSLAAREASRGQTY